MLGSVLVLMASLIYYWILMALLTHYWVLMALSTYYWVLMAVSTHYWVLMASIILGIEVLLARLSVRHWPGPVGGSASWTRGR